MMLPFSAWWTRGVLLFAGLLMLAVGGKSTTTLVHAFSQDKPKPDNRAFGYTIDLDTSGGWTGRGRGGVTINSDGSVRGSRSGSTRDTSCAATLSSDELKAVSDAVATAQRRSWPETFNPPSDNGCCDRFQYTLRLWLADPDPNGPGRTFTARWHEPRGDTLPKDIAVIRDVSLSALKRALNRCKSGLDQALN